MLEREPGGKSGEPQATAKPLSVPSPAAPQLQVLQVSLALHGLAERLGRAPTPSDYHALRQQEPDLPRLTELYGLFGPWPELLATIGLESPIKAEAGAERGEFVTVSTLLAWLQRQPQGKRVAIFAGDGIVRFELRDEQETKNALRIVDGLLERHDHRPRREMWDHLVESALAEAEERRRRDADAG